MSNTPRQGIPKIDQLLTVCLPSELTRAQVVEVVDPDHIKAKIVQTPMAKTHTYQLGQTIDFLRIDTFSGERWESV